jgi:hypothetical protein
MDHVASAGTTRVDGTFKSTTDWALAAFEIRQRTTAAQSLASDTFATHITGPSNSLLAGFLIHPNPFGPGTSIDYALASEAPVEVSVFNVRGERVRTLTAGPQPAGTWKLYWDGRSDRGTELDSGVYFLRTRVADARRTYKLVMLR